MATSEELEDAIEALVETHRKRHARIDRSITDRMETLEGPQSSETIARLKTDLDALFGLVAAVNTELDAQADAIVTLARYVIDAQE